MALTRYICILEDNYEDRCSWDWHGVAIPSSTPVRAAEMVVEVLADELGLDLDDLNSVTILVKAPATGEITRVNIGAEMAVNVTFARRDKLYVPPKE